MGEFTDNIDNTFSDTQENPVQNIQIPADSSNVSEIPTDTGVTDTVDVPVTPVPVPEDTPVSGEDVIPDDSADNTTDTVTCTYNIDDIYSLLSDIKTGNEEYQKTTTEYQTQVLENDSFLMEQSKNILSVSSLLLLTVGFVSGILLARAVWRKL